MVVMRHVSINTASECCERHKVLHVIVNGSGSKTNGQNRIKWEDLFYNLCRYTSQKTASKVVGSTFLKLVNRL